jgi:hypothetical protein
VAHVLVTKGNGRACLVFRKNLHPQSDSMVQHSEDHHVEATERLGKMAVPYPASLPRINLQDASQKCSGGGTTSAILPAVWSSPSTPREGGTHAYGVLCTGFEFVIGLMNTYKS